MASDAPEDKLTPQQLEDFKANLIDTVEVVPAVVTGVAILGSWSACRKGATAGAIAGSFLPGVGSSVGAIAGCATGALIAWVFPGAKQKLKKIGLHTANKIGKSGEAVLEPIVNDGKKLFNNMPVIIKDAFKKPNTNTAAAVAVGAFQAYDAGNLGHPTNNDNEKKEPPKEEEEEKKTEILELKHFPTTDFNIKKGEETKIIRPLTGVVTPRIKLLYFNKVGGEYLLADLCFYLRVIGISWLDADETYIPSITITCAYHPDIAHLAIGTRVIPLIGTHEGSMVSLGVFFLNKINKNFSHGNYTARLGFSAMDFKNPYANSPEPKPKRTPKKQTYMDEIKRFEQTMKFKVDVEHAKHKLNKESTLNIDNATTTALHRLNEIASELELSLTIKNKTLIMRDRASDKDRINYKLSIGVASNFDITYDLTNSFHTVQVISSKLTKNGKEIMGVAQLQGQATSDKSRVMTRFMEAKNEEEAKRLAKTLLNRVNTSVTSCSITVPNCILFAGHNITIDQNIPNVTWGEYPLHLRIQKAQHDISYSGWTCTLTLQAVDLPRLDADTASYQLAQKTKGLEDEFLKAVQAFRSVVENKDKLMAYIKAIYKRAYKFQKHERHKEFIYAWLHRAYLYHKKYPDRDVAGAIADEFTTARKNFEKKAKEIDNKLKELGSSLLALGKNPEYYIQNAYNEFNQRCIVFFNVGVEEKEEDKG